MVHYIHQTVSIESPIDGPKELRRVEKIAKISHASPISTTIEDTEAFVKKLISWGHESVLEHTLITVEIVTSRGITHELVRHRHASFLQESTRYVKYNEISVIQSTFLSENNLEMWKEAMESAAKSYKALLENNKPEIARSVLPTDLSARIFMTANLREWRLILKLRLGKEAHPDMRELMGMILSLFKKSISVVFDDM